MRSSLAVARRSASVDTAALNPRGREDRELSLRVELGDSGALSGTASYSLRSITPLIRIVNGEWPIEGSTDSAQISGLILANTQVRWLVRRGGGRPMVLLGTINEFGRVSGDAFGVAGSGRFVGHAIVSRYADVRFSTWPTGQSGGRADFVVSTERETLIGFGSDECGATITRFSGPLFGREYVDVGPEVVFDRKDAAPIAAAREFLDLSPQIPEPFPKRG